MLIADWMSDTDYAPAELDVHHRVLADQVGNLVMRINPKMRQAFVKAIESSDSASLDTPSDEARALHDMLRTARGTFDGQIEGLEVSKALSGVMDMVAEVSSVPSRSASQ